MAVRRLGSVLGSSGRNHIMIIALCYRSSGCINEGIYCALTNTSASHLCALLPSPFKMNVTSGSINPSTNPLALLPNPLTPMAFLPPDIAVQVTISTYVLIALTTVSVFTTTTALKLARCHDS